MNQRDKWIGYYGQRLGYFLPKQIEQLLVNNTSIENAIIENKLLSERQLHNVQFLYIKQCLLQYVQSLGHLNNTQYKDLLEEKIISLKKGEPFYFNSLKRGFFELDFFQQIVKNMLRQRVFVQRDVDLFHLVVQTTTSLVDTHMVKDDTQDDLANLRRIASPQSQERLGPYQLLEEIGAGGMGKVYIKNRGK